MIRSWRYPIVSHGYQLSDQRDPIPLACVTKRIALAGKHLLPATPACPTHPYSSTWLAVSHQLFAVSLSMGIGRVGPLDTYGQANN